MKTFGFGNEMVGETVDNPARQTFKRAVIVLSEHRLWTHKMRHITASGVTHQTSRGGIGVFERNYLSTVRCLTRHRTFAWIIAKRLKDGRTVRMWHTTKDRKNRI